MMVKMMVMIIKNQVNGSLSGSSKERRAEVWSRGERCSVAEQQKQPIK